MLLTDNYHGGISKLTDTQEKELLKELENKVYTSAKEVCAYVEATFQVSYTPEGMVHLLHRLGFVYKKTKHVPGKADVQKQEEFIKQYEEIKENMGKTDKIYFLDGTHPHHNSIPAYGWIPRGKTIELKSNTGRERLNINGALNIENTEVIIIEEETINAEAVIIYVIADNARYNRAKIVQEYLQHSKIKMIFLPPYATNLNLIERLWGFFKRKILYNKYYESIEEFRKRCLDFFKDILLYKNELSTLLRDEFQIIGNNVLQT